MMMYSGGTMVAKGSYWDPMDGRRITMQRQGILPGKGVRSYLKISSAGLLLIAPLFGTMFIFFLPFFGLAVLGILCIIPALGAVSTINASAVQTCCGITNRVGALKAIRIRQKVKRARSRRGSMSRFAHMIGHNCGVGFTVRKDHYATGHSDVVEWISVG